MRFPRPVHSWAAVLAAVLSASACRAQDTALPPPLPMPAGDTHAQAAALARRVTAGGPDSLSALLTALQASGFYVRDRSGRVLLQPLHPPGMGLAYTDWEVRLLTLRPRKQPRILFSSLSDALSVPLKEMGKEQIHAGILDGIRKCAADQKHPDLQFWATFIIELGKWGADGYCLTIPDSSASKIFAEDLDRDKKLAQRAKTSTAATAQAFKTGMDRYGAIVTAQEKEQQALNARLMAAVKARDQATINSVKAEIEAVNKRYEAQLEAFKTQQNPAAQASGQVPIAMEYAYAPLSLLQASLITKRLGGDMVALALKVRPKEQARLDPMRIRNRASCEATQTQAQPQNLNIDPSTVQDAAATAFPEAFSQMADMVAEILRNKGQDALAENWTNYVSRAGQANAAFAFAKLVLLYGCLQIDVKLDALKLVRTKTKTPGEVRHVTATVTEDLGQFNINFARAAFNMIGLDITQPAGGPIKGAAIDWELTEGGAGISRTAGPFAPAQTADGYLELGPGFRNGVQTDAAGKVTTPIEGSPQKLDMGTNVAAFPREGEVLAKVRLKVGTISQDVVDAIGIAVNVRGESGAYWINAITDMLTRTSLLSAKYCRFDVTDWRRPSWVGQYRITVRGNASMEKGTLRESWTIDRSMEGSLEAIAAEDTNPGRFSSLRPNGRDQRYRVRDAFDLHNHLPPDQEKKAEGTIDEDRVLRWTDMVQVGKDPLFGQPIWARPIIVGNVALDLSANSYHVTFGLGASCPVECSYLFDMDLGASRSSGTRDETMSLGGGIEGFEGMKFEGPIPADARELHGSETKTLKCTFQNLPGTVEVTVEWQLIRQKTQSTGGRT